MKLRLVKKQTIINYIDQNRNAKSHFDNWLNTLKYADWQDTHDMTETFNSADFLGKGSDRVIFNVGGNNYRIICSYFIGRTNFHLYINWIGTHSEYDKLCDQNRQYTVNNY